MKLRNFVTDAVADVMAERNAQDRKWGEQNHPLLDPDCPISDIVGYYNLPEADHTKWMCETDAAFGTSNWVSIFLEEFTEFLDEMKVEDYKKAREELVQSAAVLLAAIESFDRNGK